MSSKRMHLLVLSIFLIGAVRASTPEPSPRPTCEELLPQFLSEFAAGGSPEPLPVPPDVLPRPIPDTGFILEKLRPGVYSVLDGVYYSLIVLRGAHLVLVDFPTASAGGTAGTSVRGFASVAEAAALRVLGAVRPRRIDFVYSHGHRDHIGTAAVTKRALQDRFPRARFRIWASRAAAARIRASGSSRAPSPTAVIRRAAVLRVGGRQSSLRLILKAIGGHTADDVLVYIPPSGGHGGVAFLVDVVVPGWAPPPNFAFAEDLRAYIRAHDAVLRLSFETFVGGHLTRLGSRRDVQASRNYIFSVFAAVRAAQAAAAPFARAAAPLGFFDPARPAFGHFYFATVALARSLARDCARRIIAHWGCRLAGVEVAAESHCLTARTFLFATS